MEDINSSPTNKETISNKIHFYTSPLSRIILGREQKIFLSPYHFSVLAKHDHSDENIFSNNDVENSYTDIIPRPVIIQNVSNILIFISEHLMAILSSIDNRFHL